VGSRQEFLISFDRGEFFIGHPLQADELFTQPWPFRFGTEGGYYHGIIVPMWI
jgi:hypothetical protein